MPDDILTGFPGPRWAIFLANILVLIHMIPAFQGEIFFLFLFSLLLALLHLLLLPFFLFLFLFLLNTLLFHSRIITSTHENKQSGPNPCSSASSSPSSTASRRSATASGRWA